MILRSIMDFTHNRAGFGCQLSRELKSINSKGLDLKTEVEHFREHVQTIE